MKKENTFWKAPKRSIPLRKPIKIKPVPRMKPIKTNVTTQAKDMVKLGVGAGIGLVALGAGLSAFKSLSDS